MKFTCIKKWNRRHVLPGVDELIKLADVEVSDPETKVVDGPHVKGWVTESSVNPTLGNSSCDDLECIYERPAGVDGQCKRVQNCHKLKSRTFWLHIKCGPNRVEDHIRNGQVQQHGNDRDPRVGEESVKAIHCSIVGKDTWVVRRQKMLQLRDGCHLFKFYTQYNCAAQKISLLLQFLAANGWKGLMQPHFPVLLRLSKMNGAEIKSSFFFCSKLRFHKKTSQK